MFRRTYFRFYFLEKFSQLTATRRRMYQCNSFMDNRKFKSVRLIDLRSDSQTKPSAAMRLAMQNAIVGDDFCREDPTKRCADMFGMEASLFLPTASMANLISIMAHCHDRRDSEIIFGDKSHIHGHEQGAYAQIAGVSANILPNNEDGTISLDMIEKAIRNHAHIHEPKTQLICLENTHTYCGGRALSVDYHRKVYEFARNVGVKVHIDGARLLNACVNLGVEAKDILKFGDSVSMCFSKGLGAPIGAILAGSKEFIDKSLRIRKVLGAAWAQAGIMAAPALISLDNWKCQLMIDHQNAALLAESLCGLKSPLINVKIDAVETNIVLVQTSKHITAEQIGKLLSEAYFEDDVAVLCWPNDEHVVRFVTHCDISTDDIKLVIKKFERVLSEVDLMK